MDIEGVSATETNVQATAPIQMIVQLDPSDIIGLQATHFGCVGQSSSIVSNFGGATTLNAVRIQ
jgi:hypothetical protein